MDCRPRTSPISARSAERLHLPFAILSDAELKLTRAMRLPTFSVDGMTLIKRMAWVIDDGVMTKVFYRCFRRTGAPPRWSNGSRRSGYDRRARRAVSARAPLGRGDAGQ